MKTIGILGGMSAASTQVYYRELCDMTRERLGGLHSPEVLIRSLDFAVIEALQMAGEWDRAGGILNFEAKSTGTRRSRSDHPCHKYNAQACRSDDGRRERSNDTHCRCNG